LVYPLRRFYDGKSYQSSILRIARLGSQRFDRNVARVRQASSPVTTLLKILVDPNAPLTVKARAAYYILDQTKKAMETEEIEARVSEPEKAAGDRTQADRMQVDRNECKPRATVDNDEHTQQTTS
jgi:hypothetical protein